MKDLSILELAADLVPGQSAAGLVCPYCGGGSSKEGSLSLSREKEYVLFKCHRASCSAGGKVSERSSAAKTIRHKQREWPQVHKVPDDVTEYLVARYHLTDEELRRAEFGWVTKYSSSGKGRLHIPTMTYLGAHRGFVARDLSKDQPGPKALTFKYRVDDNNIGWYYRGRAYPVVLVEDAFSALRISSYCTGVFLNGTNISEAEVDELIRVPAGRVHLALDRDATRAAVKMALKYRSRLDIKVVPLQKDIKDLSRDQLTELMKEILYVT